MPEVETANAGAMLEALRSLPFVTVGCGEPTIRKGKSGTFSDAGLAGASHHAIVPNVNTRQQGAECYPQLSADERQLFKAITRGYLAAIDPDWVYDRTEISVQPNDRKFAAASAIDIDPGWRAAVGPDHNFSKRTKTYALYTRVNMEDPIFGLICWKDL